MRLLSFRRGGQEGYGVAVGEDGVFDLTSRFGDYADLSRALGLPNVLSDFRRVAEGSVPDFSSSDLEFAPVIPNPHRLICVGVNYRAHANEAGRGVSQHPSVFLRLPDSVVGHLQSIIRPRVSTHLDYEGELAVVIGRGGRYISRTDALSHVAGYSIFNDASVRDWQRHNPGPTPGKNFFHCGSFGPWLVTSDEIPDPAKLTLTTRVNGEQRQQTSLSLMIFDVPAIIEYVSSFTPLQPGDVISTGTPAGVAMSYENPPWLRAGDLVEVEITSIGTLQNTISDEGEF